MVNVEHPVEIIAKKIYHRADVFKPRDVFDLAVVYYAYQGSILKNATVFAKELPSLSKRIEAIEHSGELEDMLKEHAILPGGEKIRGKETVICKQFIKDVEYALDYMFRENAWSEQWHDECSREEDREVEKTKTVPTQSKDMGFSR
jgi:hypothetical protein